MYTYFRFTNVTIPQGSTIVGCFIRFTAKADQSGTTVNLNIYFDTADNPAAYGSGSQITSASLTSAVAWNSIGSWTDGNKYDSPELKTIFQGIVDAATWDSGDAVIAQVRDNGSNSGAYRSTSGYDFSSGSEKAELHIEYEVISVSSSSSSSSSSSESIP
jgi:hypothetical protein